MKDDIEKIRKDTVNDLVGSKTILNADTGNYNIYAYDNNDESHTRTLINPRGYITLDVTVWFTPDLVEYYLCNWSWEKTSSGNPVTISMTDENIFITVTSNQALHGVWKPDTGWQKFTEGWWVVHVT